MIDLVIFNNETYNTFDHYISTFFEISMQQNI